MKKTSNPSRNNNISLICGVISSTVFFYVMGMFGSPYDIIHVIDGWNIIPPIWLWKVTTTVWGFLIGFALGKIIFAASGPKSSIDTKIYAYRGGLFYLSAFFLALFHYPLFFNAGKIFISLLVAVIATVLSAVCGTMWTRVSRSASLIMYSYTFWLFYVVFVNFSIFFRI